MTLDSAALNVRHPALIRALYEDMPLQCVTTGVRFRRGAEVELQDYTDQLFRKKQAKEARAVRTRGYYLEAKIWVTLTDAKSREERLQSDVFGAGGEKGGAAPEGDASAAEERAELVGEDVDAICGICGDPFEKFYSDERGEWMYRDAIRVNGTLYMYSVYMDAEANDNLPSPLGAAPPDIPGLDTGKSEPAAASGAGEASAVKVEPVVPQEPEGGEKRGVPADPRVRPQAEKRQRKI